VILCLAVLAVSALPAAAAEPPHLDGQLVVRFAPGADAGDRAGIRREAGATVRSALPVPGAQLLAVRDVEAAEAELERTPGVLYAEPNFRLTPDATTNDPYYGSSWNLWRIGIEDAWDITIGSRDVTVAVIDSGVEIDHPDLQGNLWRNPGETGDGRQDNGDDDDGNGKVDDWRGWNFGWDARSDHNDPSDYGGHGTNVAGVIGAVGGNGIGPSGVAQRVSIMPLSVWDAGSAGVAAAIEYASDKGVKVANGSFGIPYSQLIEDALAANPDLMLSVSAGNQAWDVEQNKDARYPCVSKQPNVVCVAATDEADGLAGFSNWGSESVELGAPGVGVPSLGLAPRSLLLDYFSPAGPLAGHWAVGGTGGAWRQMPNSTAWSRSHGTHGADPSPDGPYPNDADTWMVNATPFDLTGHGECGVYPMLSTDLAPGDVFRIEASAGGGDWTLLREYTGSRIWASESSLLTAMEGLADVRVRFRLVTDDAGQAKGVRIHNVQVFCDEPAFRGTEYPKVMGTSNAAPHIAGTAALMLSVDPSLTADQLRERILATVKPLPALEGRTVTGGRLDTARALGVTPKTPTAPPAPGPSGGTPPGIVPTPPVAGPPVTSRDLRAPRCRRPQLDRRRRLTVRCDEPARIGARLSTGRTTLGRAAAKRHAARRVLRVRLTRAGTRLLRRRRAVRATLTVIVTDAAGNRATVTRRITLRR
jgi:thermitase